MRSFSRGEPFISVSCEGYIPNAEALAEMEEDLKEIPRDEFPVFSEAFLYPRVGKDDARFILGVAEEYEAVIHNLGGERVRQILEQERQKAES